MARTLTTRSHFRRDLLYRSRKYAFAASLLLLIGSTIAGSPVPASAAPGSEYTTLRRQKRYDPTVSYAKVQVDPSLYQGKVIELAGKVEGSSSDGKSLSVVLVLGEDLSASLDLPLSALLMIHEDPTARLRVLVEVGEPLNTNVPPLKVLGFAHESEVRQLEQAEEAKMQAARDAQERRRKSEERWKKEAQRTVAYTGSSSAAVAAVTPPAAALQQGSYAESLAPRAKPLFWPYYTFIAKTNDRLDSAAVAKITFHLLNFADRYNVDPRLVVAMIFAESHFNPNATSHSGAMGLGQLMPGTARALGVDNPYDPIQNLGGSINYLRSRLDTFSDHAAPGGAMSFEQAALAMAAYNAGTNAVKKYNGIPPYTQTQNYVKKVISLYQQLCR